MHMIVLATAYCLNGLTARGTPEEFGVIAVDPNIIPLRSRVRIHGWTYRAEDTGAYIHGHHIDVYMSSCREARQYGVRRIHINILD